MRNTIKVVGQQSFMETHLTATLLMALFSSAFAVDECLRYEDLNAATGQMRTARYFTFVTLVNMVRENLAANVTFLMSHDQMISMATVPIDGVLDFVQAHSIPSLLLFDDLRLLPTGSIIPTSKPGFDLRISNNGRAQFYLNNVRLVSSNLCMHVSSVTCHGMDGVLWMPDRTNASRNCSSSSSIGAPPEALGGSPAPLNQTTSDHKTPDPQRSGAATLLYGRPISMIISCLMILITGLSHEA